MPPPARGSDGWILGSRFQRVGAPAEQQAIEDGELEHPEEAERGKFDEVEDNLGIGVGAGDPGSNDREDETDKRNPSERQHLGAQAILRPLL